MHIIWFRLAIFFLFIAHPLSWEKARFQRLLFIHAKIVHSEMSAEKLTHLTD